jgi:hypothetical protein
VSEAGAKILEDHVSWLEDYKDRLEQELCVGCWACRLSGDCPITCLELEIQALEWGEDEDDQTC